MTCHGRAQGYIGLLQPAWAASLLLGLVDIHNV